MFDNELILMEKYNITPSELYVIKSILLAQDENFDLLYKIYNILKGEFRTILKNLQSKALIVKSYKFPDPGSKFDPLEIPFNKTFVKQYYKSSFKLGNELFEAYPQFTTVQGAVYNLRRVSKKFDDLEDAFAKYAKVIRNNPETHQEIIELIAWGIENGYNFTTLDDFICDRGWLSLKAFKEGNGTNINIEAVKMI